MDNPQPTIEPTKERVVVLLTESEKRALTRLAARQRISVSATVRRLVAEELDRTALSSFAVQL